VVSSMRESEEIAPLEESIRLYGIQNTISFLVTYKLSEVYKNCKPFTKDLKTHRLLLAPSQILKFSHSARIAIGEDGRYRDSSFAAGLLFDSRGRESKAFFGDTESCRNQTLRRNYGKYCAIDLPLL
jgi:hypothetical protein